MRLHDHTTGELREVEIRDRMTVYVCGITPYDVSHLGHAFTFVHFDVLVRYLRYLGADVVHVQNVTDVDDDMLRVARERGVDWRELGIEGVTQFDEAVAAINVRPPTRSPRATEFIAEIVEEVAALQSAGVTYARAGRGGLRRAVRPPLGAHRPGALRGREDEQVARQPGHRGGGARATLRRRRPAVPPPAPLPARLGVPQEGPG